MKVVVVVLVLVVGALALALVWTNHSQVETISLLREQNALLWAQVEMEHRLAVRQETINRAYGRLLGDVAVWLGLEAPVATGGP